MTKKRLVIIGLAFIAVAFLLVAGCTEEKPVQVTTDPVWDEMVKSNNYTNRTFPYVYHSVGNCTENKSSYSNDGDYNDLVMHIECKGEPTVAPTPNPVPTPEYVMCSDYVRIVDKYRTVNNNIIVTSDNETNYVSTYQYANLTVGKFISTKERDNDAFIIGGGPGRVMRMYDSRWAGDGTTLGFIRYDHDIKQFDSVIPVAEAESGYREACKVVT